MHKSKAHFKVKHGCGLVTAVPVSYLAILQSRDNTEPFQAVKQALSEALNRKVSDGENPIVDTTQVIDESGWVISGGTGIVTDQTFTVYEHSNGFSLTHNPSGKTHSLSDGVDVLQFVDHDAQTHDVLSPGTIGFTELWTEEMNDNEAETLEAYFPELIDEPLDTDDTDDVMIEWATNATRSQLVKMLEAVGIQCYDWEDEEVLCQAVLTNYKDGTIRLVDIPDID